MGSESKPLRDRRCAVEYLRQVGTFERLLEQIRALPGACDALLTEVLLRAEAVCGAAAVASTLPLIAVATPVWGAHCALRTSWTS